jgi:hypothetical protein
MTLKEMVQKQILDTEEQIKILSEKIDYLDSINQPYNKIALELGMLQGNLTSLKAMIANTN